MFAGASPEDALPIEPTVAHGFEPTVDVSVEPTWVGEDEDAVEPVAFDLSGADAPETDEDPMADPGHPAWPTMPSGWSDAVTSTDGPRYWDRLLSSERDRVRRYRRPATIVFIEIANLERLGVLWGDDVAAQSLVRVGRTVMHEIRSSDHAARIDVARFAVFLPETTEIAAINFVERVRASIDEALGEMAETVHVGIGWASPADGNLDLALVVAEERLAADLSAERESR
jgi:diguanylate cyclase (GGDEF)-like protein